MAASSSASPQRQPAWSLHHGREAQIRETRALEELGQAVRSRRKRLGLTLSQVSEQAGLSVPFLSQVETSFAAPSLTSLFAIARVLQTTPERLLAGPVSADVVITHQDEGQRYDITDAAQTAFRRQLSGLDEPFSAAEYVVEPGSRLGGFFASEGREMIHVTQGMLAVELDDGSGGIVSHRLAAGDTMIYSTATRHRWQHLGSNTTRFIHISTPI